MTKIKILFFVLFLIKLHPALAQDEKEITFSNLDLFNLSSNKTKDRSSDYFTHLHYYTYDLTYQKENGCDYFFDLSKKILKLNTKNYLGLSRLYCRQKKNDYGQYVAQSILIAHIVENPFPDSPNQDLINFLNEMNGRDLFGAIISYSPVKKLIKERTLKAKHSFPPYYTLLQETFFTSVMSVAQYKLEDQTILKSHNFQVQTDYTDFILTSIKSQQAGEWLKLFDNPKADIITIYTNNTHVQVQSPSGNKTVILKNLLSSTSFADTRWDEYINENDLPSYVFQDICVNIDTRGTDHPKYLNIARNVFDVGDYFYLKPNNQHCFDYNKTYYMQHFLYGDGPYIWYGTTCRYLPYHRHNGKTLHYEGEHGSHKCPVKENEI